MRLRTRMLIGALLSALVLSGCGENSSSTEDVQALEERVAAAEQKAADAEAAAEAAATEAPPAEEADRDEVVEEEPAQEESAADCVKVPNVVGKDHQLAQDTMQAAGLYMLDEEDASGEGRMLLLDRNWTTVKQRPKAGKCVDENTTILLSALKDEEA